MLDELARVLGWVVIGCGIFWIIGKTVISLSEERQTQKNFDELVWDHERRLALRKIWRTTRDEKIISQVKSLYGAWSAMYPEMTDEEYSRHVQATEGQEAYCAALFNIERDGFSYYLSNDGVVVMRTKSE